MLHQRFINLTLGLVSATALINSSLASAQDEPLDRAGQIRFFENKIRPVLVKECYGCHSQKTGNVRGGLLVDTKKGLADGGDSGPAIVPGELDESTLWSAINHEDWVMPPKRKLPDNVIEDFRKWIEMGAPDPRSTKKVKINSTITKNDIRKGREFWSFKSPKKQDVPEVQSEEWAKTEIDQFVLQKLESNGLNPSVDADPQTFLRRLTFDLIGLPPTPAQLEWFQEEWKTDPDKATAHVVDSLLKSPRYGERWGRHWLDVARYAESSGKELNATYPHAWRYRDYVIDSFNNDKPYDQFVIEQIAGDLMPAKTDEQWSENLVATGFLAIGTKTLTEQNPRQFIADLVDEQIDTTTRVFMGLSVACARCHDHKFDPIPQTDYYALAGVFYSTNTHYGTIDTLQNRRSSALIELPIKEQNQKEKLSKTQLNELKDRLSELQEDYREAVRQRREMRRNGNANNARNNILSVGRLSAQIGIVESILESYDKNGNPMSFCMGVQPADQPQDATLYVRGEITQPAQTVERGFVQVVRSRPTKIKPDSSGRLEFAKWVANKDNPLTARVMVNRIWQHMLGEGIVRSPENFGMTGMQPTHPELLDYLARRFVENDWSVKRLIREIALSRVYRQSAGFDEDKFNVDPENHYVWRANSRRLDAESLRDALLCASGEIEYQRPNGSLVSQAGETIVRDGQLQAIGMQSQSRSRSRGGSVGGFSRNFTPIDQASMNRSVFLPIVRDDLPQSLAAFDFAEPSMVVGKREESNTPAQGLYFLNNNFVIDQCDAMAKRLLEHSKEPAEQIELAFILVYGREPTRDEEKLASKFLKNFQSATRRSKRETANLSAFCQALFASAEFRYLD